MLVLFVKPVLAGSWQVIQHGWVCAAFGVAHGWYCSQSIPVLWLCSGIVGVVQLPVVVAAKLLPYRYGKIFAFRRVHSVGALA